jgi:hypothetical protein
MTLDAKGFSYRLFRRITDRSDACSWPIVLKKSPGNYFKQISVMSTAQPIHDRAMVDVLDIRVTDLSLPVRTGPEFFQHNRPVADGRSGCVTRFKIG